MDSFGFLKYLRSSGSTGEAGSAVAAGAGSTIAASVLCSSDDNEEEDDGGDDDGPFFDLEFAAVSDGDEEEGEERSAEEVNGAGEEIEREFNFAVSSSGGGDEVGFDTLSPSHDLLFKGKLVPFDPSSVVIAGGDVSEADPKPQFPAYFLRTATKFRVFLLGLRKPKLSPAEAEPTSEATAPMATAAPKKEQQQQNKFFIKFKVVDAPLVSFFSRDGGSRSYGGGLRAAKTPTEESAHIAGSPTTEAEKKLVREMLQKYINKIKPLYVRVSRKYAERLRLTGHLPPADTVAAEPVALVAEETESEVTPPPPPSPAEEVAPPPTPAEATPAPPPQPVPAVVAGGGKILAAGLRVVYKRLGKSRSASAAVAAVPSPPPPPPPPRRRDDSLLQQQDGIQSAIAHCKRSFTVADQSSESPLARSMSDPGEGRADRNDASS
ncbi:probable membrane-associated kinase regulator 2 [Zingiber officinale]|uniref:probable membrane-associated kinase regulator 2 n=1 Tax=Zingiber officinale TaxID=94328 RepID=UPI001C4D2F9E|nr:probable membrane-associated kinase regulator 2 [Zingiber officinale]